MTPLQKVAMGLVLTLVDPIVAGFDAVPDVLGWVMVLVGLRHLRGRMPVTTLVPLALLAALVSLATLRPDLLHDLPESGGWLLSLPQIAFSLVLSAELASVTGSGLAGRFRLVRWLFVAVAVGPVLVYGGGLDVLVIPVAVLAVAVNVYFVYLVFRASTDVHGPRARLRDDAPDPD
jgi:hypothetical protein